MTEEQWLAISNKDKSFDGVFFYALKTTKVVCRPSCRKKQCSPENVVIFDSVDEAVEAGYRPCKKCRPELQEWKGSKRELSDALMHLIDENYAKDFSLAGLADMLHINKFYMLRAFKEITGTTPLEYHNNVRCEHAKEMLKQPELSINYISTAIGCNSASHFSRVFKKVVGSSPSAYRKAFLKKQSSLQ